LPHSRLDAFVQFLAQCGKGSVDFGWRATGVEDLGDATFDVHAAFQAA